MHFFSDSPKVRQKCRICRMYSQISELERKNAVYAEPI